MEDNSKGGVRLMDLSEDLFSLSAVIYFVLDHATKNSMVAIDASLIVKNDIGQRPCGPVIGRTCALQCGSGHSAPAGPNIPNASSTIRRNRSSSTIEPDETAQGHRRPAHKVYVSR